MNYKVRRMQKQMYGVSLIAFWSLKNNVFELSL